MIFQEEELWSIRQEEWDKMWMLGDLSEPEPGTDGEIINLEEKFGESI